MKNHNIWLCVSLSASLPPFLKNTDKNQSSKMATILSINPLASRLFPSNSQRYSVFLFPIPVFNFLIGLRFIVFMFLFQMQCYLRRTVRIGQAEIHIQTNCPVSFTGFLQFSKRLGKISSIHNLFRYLK